MTLDDPLDPDLIRANLKTRRIGRSLLVYERTASTNDVAGHCARGADSDGLVVFTEEQTAGRGRTGATWLSRAGESLLFSFVLLDFKAGNELLSLACAVGVAEAIGQVGGHQAGIKWPNDVMLDGKKVAGILVESRLVAWDAKRQSRVTRDGARVTTIVGIGINCHQSREAFPDQIRNTATSLDLVGGTTCQRVTVAKRVLTSLDHWIGVAERNSQQVVETWSRLSTQLNQRVALSYNGKSFVGNCIGVDPENGLILQLDRGGVRMFDAAHTHRVR